MENNQNHYDFFISHASEDKESIARPIYNALRRLGFKVWFDKAEISLGDNLVNKIQEGLARSKFGIVILSENFFSKKKVWTKFELDILLMQDISIANKILPVWSGVTLEYVLEHSPFLASKNAVNVNIGLPEVVREIYNKAKIEGVTSAPVQFLAIIWRPSPAQAFMTIGADVFCIVSESFKEAEVFLCIHQHYSEETKKFQMTKFNKEIMNPTNKYSIYSTFLRAPDQTGPRFFGEECSILIKTEIGEFVDDNNGALYRSGHNVPEIINYNALVMTGGDWMGDNIRKWSHNNWEYSGYGGRKIDYD